jgi:uncharacterized protein involved in exopolysaccharide biosynthesis
MQEDKIDIRELFAILKRRKKVIYGVTTAFTLIALLYVMMATPWWQVNTTLEIGKYINTKTGEEIYLENGAGVAERLKVEYIDVYAHVKDRDSKIESISASKKNPQFISITALAKSNELALKEIKPVINALQSKHKRAIDEIIAKKQSQLDEVDRKIYQLNTYTMANIKEKIAYLKNIQLPALEKKISALQLDLEKSRKQKEEATKNLSSLGSDASLAALRLAEIQGLEYKIAANEMKLIDFNTQKQQILTAKLPELSRELEKLQKIDLVKLQEERKLIQLSMQPHNYANTKIVGSIITQEKPVKPKKSLIVIVAFITGLMFSVFLAFFLEFLQGMKREE